MLNNMVTSLFASERIATTAAKAKEARRLAERLITRARKGYTAHQEVLSLKEAGKEDEARQMEAVALAHWRQAGRYIRKISILKKLFEEIAPHFVGREGGYTRIVRTGNRLGDNAQTVLLELVGTEKTERPVGKKEADGAEPKKEAKPKAKSKPKAKGKTKEKAEDKEDKADKKAKSSQKSKSKTRTKSKSKSQTISQTKTRTKSKSKSSGKK